MLNMTKDKFVVMIFLMFVGTLALAGGAPVNKGDDYATARARLIGLRWNPFITHKLMADGAEERNWGDAKRMREAGFEEIESCTGTGLNFCIFNFKKGSVCMRITTVGEYRNDQGSPKVEAWSKGRCREEKK